MQNAQGIGCTALARQRSAYRRTSFTQLSEEPCKWTGKGYIIWTSSVYWTLKQDKKWPIHTIIGTKRLRKSSRRAGNETSVGRIDEQHCKAIRAGECPLRRVCPIPSY